MQLHLLVGCRRSGFCSGGRSTRRERLKREILDILAPSAHDATVAVDGTRMYELLQLRLGPVSGPEARAMMAQLAMDGLVCPALYEHTYVLNTDVFEFSSR
eukprot:2466153-Rhodomonas_salina.1